MGVDARFSVCVRLARQPAEVSNESLTKLIAWTFSTYGTTERFAFVIFSPVRSKNTKIDKKQKHGAFVIVIFRTVRIGLIELMIVNGASLRRML